METLAAALAVVALALAAALAWAFLARTKLIAAVAAAESEAKQHRLALAGAQDEFRQYREAREGELREMRARLDDARESLTELREALKGSETAREGEARRHREREQLLEEEARKAEARLREELAKSEQRVQKAVAEIEQRTREAFESLAGKTLEASQQSFLRLAQETMSKTQQASAAELEQRRQAIEALVKPIGESLGKTQERLLALNERVDQSREESERLRAETAKLAKALSRPEVRGRYGEIQLRRVAELAGMTSYCDFCEQAHSVDGEGRAQRPDMLVQLPNDRVIAVDAKCNIDAYLRAVSAETDGEREELLEKFAKHVAEQARALGDKKYWASYEGSPEFVVMFVPGDQFIDAALARRNDLIELAARSNVVLASPSTLIGLLRAVYVGWRESKLAEDARELFRLGAELHDRARVAFDHIDKLGSSLRTAVGHYNNLVGSVERRLVPTLRRFEETGVKGAGALPQPTEATELPRRLEAADQNRDRTRERLTAGMSDVPQDSETNDDDLFPAEEETVTAN